MFIADDDAGMRTMLRRIIENMEDFQIVGEAADGSEAVRLCLNLRPDVAFFDVEMPVLTGTEAARELSSLLPDVKIIFVTAHSKYMPEAFEVYAFDYLIKPFRTDRVRQTLRRLKAQKDKEPEPALGSIMIKGKDSMTLLAVGDIIMVERKERSSYIVTGDETYTTAKNLNDLWPYFQGRGYMRSHRAFIIKLSEVTRIFPYGRWTWQVNMKGTDRTALITKEKLEELEELIETVNS